MKNIFIISAIAASLIGSCLWAQEGGDMRVQSRHGSLIRVKPEYEERYIILHKHTFPGVLEQIHLVNIRNYSIFLNDGMLFSYFEYIGDDFKADMERIADETTKEWWKLTDPMQEPLPTRKEGEWWAEMEALFCLDKKGKPSEGARRFALVAELDPEHKEAFEKLCGNFSADVKALTYKHHFQNCTLYYKDGKVYYYYEYTGEDVRSDMGALNQNPAFTNFQAELNQCLVDKAGNLWQIMQEVFHTD